MNNLWILAQKKRRFNNKLLEAGFTPIMADILFQRGFTDLNSILEYLRPSQFNFHSPYLFKDMKKVIARLEKAYKNREKILIYGDYDADGVTGTALLYKVFLKFGFNVMVHIPSREEGYGLHPEMIEKAADSRVDLIVTVDCGITALKETELAADKGIDVIITDHHEPLQDLPQVVGILNPKMKESGYPFPNLAGVGVAFKLTQALFSHFRHLLTDTSSESDYLDLVALGTIADIVPLVGENRIIVRYGLEKMEQTIHTGIKAILEECGLAGRKLTSGQISFIVAPRINAAGRMDTARIALNLLLEEDYEDARSFARGLSKENQLRQTVEKEIVSEIQSILDSGEVPKVIVLSSPKWHHGVIGIVASRLVERYRRPVFLIAEDGDTGKGSARGIEGYNIIEELEQQAHLLEKYGGHKLAAGFSIAVRNIDLFRKALNEKVEEDQTLLLAARYNIDSAVSWKDLDLNLVKELEQMAPFGAGNPAPLLLTQNLTIDNVFAVGKEGDHLKMMLRHEDVKTEALAFKKGNEIERLKKIHNLDIIYYLESNSFLGEEKLQAIIKDYREAVSDSFSEIACSNEYSERTDKDKEEHSWTEDEDTEDNEVSEDNDEYPVLTREILVDFYKRLKGLAQDNDCLCWQLQETQETQENLELNVLKVFEELKLITWLGGTGPYYLKINNINKTDLNNSLRYRTLSIKRNCKTD